MKSQTFTKTAVLALGMSFSFHAFADMVAIHKRCDEDSLSPAQAIERVEWYQKNYSAEILAQAQSVTGDMTVTMDDAIAWYRNSMLTDPIKGGPAKRPQYPTFTIPPPDYTNPNNYFAPGYQWNPATVPVTGKDRNAAADKPTNYGWTITCVSSCYKPGEQLLFGSDNGFTNVAIEQAMSEALPKVAVLSDESTLETPRLTAQDVLYYINSSSETDHEILDFVTLSGGSLKVTPNHPVVDETGRVREASTFVVGESLVHSDGTLDPIISISTEQFHGRVYNIFPKTPTLMGQIVVANGFLNGSAWYQNGGVDYLNRVVFRTALPAEVLE